MSGPVSVSQGREQESWLYSSRDPYWIKRASKTTLACQPFLQMKLISLAAVHCWSVVIKVSNEYKHELHDVSSPAPLFAIAASYIRCTRKTKTIPVKGRRGPWGY
jgi:hypothetical protein